MASTELLWIGRFTGPKGDLARQIIDELAPVFPQVHFTMIGGPVTDELRQTIPVNVELTGFVDDIQPWLQRADAVIGAGRVAMEGMQAGKPVLAVGENIYHGWITDKTIAAAKASNFGDCEQHHEVDMQQFRLDIENFINTRVRINTTDYSNFLRDYNADTVYSAVMNVYRQARVDSYLKRFKEIPVLTYHRVLKSPPENSRFNIYVTVDELEQQLISLRSRGYSTTTFKEISDGIQVNNPVILTFDDGYRDNYENLLPLLKKYEAKAVIFVLANRQLQSNQWDVKQGEPEWPLMNDEQLKECIISGLVEIGSHGMNHQHMPELNEADINAEVEDSKKVLEELLETEVVSFAYPYGDYSQREAEMVKQAGYLFGIGTVNGPLSIGTDRFRVRRITMFPNTKMSKFRRKTSGWYLRYCKFKGKDF